ncbi:hypothetical protein [Methyloversatilis universalis]|nr:hypothetical protein [Methyloversatilis universalis]
MKTPVITITVQIAKDAPADGRHSSRGTEMGRNVAPAPILMTLV